MFVGCYTTHLYCDNQQIKSIHPVGDNPFAELTAQTMEATIAEARRKGWRVICENNGRPKLVFCPDCNRAGHIRIS